MLKIFNIMDEEIEMLFNHEESAGTHEITWFEEQLLSGIYFYRLQAGSFIETKKMVLMK